MHTGTDLDGLGIAKVFSERAVITLQVGKIAENCPDNVAIPAQS
ncbi:hypothetical protein ACFVT2_14000 [Streptomyces sp. NPDC058000]